MFKLIDILGKTKQVEAYESYKVRWVNANYVNGSQHFEVKFELFPTKELANEFAQSLKEAFKLTKCNTLIKVIKVTKN